MQEALLKALFRATQKVYSNTSWDGTMQRSRLPASQCNSPFQGCFWKSNLILSETAPAATSPTPATTFLQKQLPVLPRWPLPGNSSYFPEPATTFLQQQLPVLQQQLPVLHQWPLIQQLPVLRQLSSLAPVTTSCTSDHLPAAATVHRTLFWIYDSP